LFEREGNKWPQMWQNNNIEEELKEREREKKYLYKQQHKV
jgi:hypothetical protein